MWNYNIEIWIYIYTFNTFKINLKGEGVNSIIVYIIERPHIVYGRHEASGWEVSSEIRYRRVNFRWPNHHPLLLDSISNFEKLNKFCFVCLHILLKYGPRFEISLTRHRHHIIDTNRILQNYMKHDCKNMWLRVIKTRL